MIRTLLVCENWRWVRPRKKNPQQRKSEKFFFLSISHCLASAVCGWNLWNSAAWTCLTLSSIQSNGRMTLYWPRHSLKRLDFSSQIHLDLKLMSDLLFDGQKQAGKNWNVTMGTACFVWCQREFHNEVYRFQAGCFQRDSKWDWERLAHFDLRWIVEANSRVWRAATGVFVPVFWNVIVCSIVVCSFCKKATRFISFICFKLYSFQLICEAIIESANQQLECRHDVTCFSASHRRGEQRHTKTNLTFSHWHPKSLQNNRRWQLTKYKYSITVLGYIFRYFYSF